MTVDIVHDTEVAYVPSVHLQTTTRKVGPDSLGVPTCPKGSPFVSKPLVNPGNINGKRCKLTYMMLSGWGLHLLKVKMHYNEFHYFQFDR